MRPALKTPASLLWAAGLLFGCGSLSYYDKPKGGDPPGAEPLGDDDDSAPSDCSGDQCDADGDGEISISFGGPDCDDDDPDVYTSAPEVCDAVDNNCDDLVDEDMDGDGADVCDDCDDDDSDRFPGASEDCDGVDSDCDGSDCLNWSDDFESGNLGAPWVLGGNVPWELISGISHEGQQSAISGIIANNQTSWMRISVDFPSGGSISFWQLVDSEEGFDELVFLIDGAERDRWSGNGSWQLESYNVSSGSHVFEWRYEKDGSQADGADSVAIDLVEFDGGTP